MVQTMNNIKYIQSHGVTVTCRMLNVAFRNGKQEEEIADEKKKVYKKKVLLQDSVPVYCRVLEGRQYKTRFITGTDLNRGITLRKETM